MASGGTTPALSVVIPNYRRPTLLRECLRSVEEAKAFSRQAVEIIVVDDGSGDDSAALVESEFPWVTLVALATNRGYPAAVNAGVGASRGRWVLTLNNDTTVDRAAFDRLLAVAESGPDIGMVAAQQRFASDPSVIYSAGMQLDRRGHVSDRLMGTRARSRQIEPVEVFGACGAAALYRHAMLDELGGFDERFAFGLEDADVAWRARMRGWRCLYAPNAVVYHDLGGTIPHGSDLRLFQAGRNRVLLIAKNLHTRQLVRNLAQIVAFDVAYVAFSCMTMRTLAPLRGRLAGLRLWREVRVSGADHRAPVALAPPTPWAEVLRRQRSWRHARSGAADGGGRPRWLNSSDAPRVLVLNQYAPPDGASTGVFALEIARALAQDDMRVTFIAGQPSYFPGHPRAPMRERRGDVSIIRLALPGRGGRATRLRRFLGYLSYLTRAALTGARLVATGRVDVIVAFHNPPLLAVLGAALAGRRRRYVCVLLDIHPDVLLATGWIRLPRALVALWDAANRWAYRRAESIVVLSEGMRSVLSEKGVDPGKIRVIPLWADPELTPRDASPATNGAAAGVRARRGVSDEELLLLFSGNMGITQRVEPIVDAAIALANAPVRFCFVGGGPEETRWRKPLADLPNVTFLRFQPDSEYRALVHASDVGIVTLAPGLERLLVPSRALPFLSAGIPLLAVMSPDSELGRLVRAYGCGACVTSAHEFVQAVEGWRRDPPSLRAARRAARMAYTQTRDREALKRRYVELCRCY